MERGTAFARKSNFPIRLAHPGVTGFAFHKKRFSALWGHMKKAAHFHGQPQRVEKVADATFRLSKKPLCIGAKWLLVVGEGKNAEKVATCGGRVS